MWPWDWSVDNLLDEVITWLVERIVETIDWLWRLLSTTFLVVPQVAALPQVQELSSRSLQVVNVGFLVVVMVCGVVVMTRETVQTRYGVGELLPRLVLGFIAANFARPICELAVNLTNGLRRALTGDHVTSDGSLNQMKAIVTTAVADGPATLLLLIIAAVVVVLVGLLWTGWIVRLGVLVILVGVAPVALACHATPWTEAAAKLWWRTLLATLGTVILQAIALHTAFSVLLSPDANVPLIGVPRVDEAAALLNLMIVAVLLWTTVKIPGLVARYVTGSQPRNSVVAAVGRIAMVRQVGRIMSARAGTVTRTSSAAASSPSGRYAAAGRPLASRVPGTPRAVTRAGPRPGQPPRFSHAAVHRPMPRPATVQPRPTFSHSTRPAPPQPAPTPGPPRQPQFSTSARQPSPASHAPAVAPQPAFSHSPAPQAPRTAGAASAVRFSDPPAPATTTPRTGRQPVATAPVFSHRRPPLPRTTTPADRTGGEKQ